MAFLARVWAPGWHSLNAGTAARPFYVVDTFDGTDAIVDAVEARGLGTGVNVYFGVHGVAERPPPGQRGGAVDVTACRCLHLDLDWESPAHKTAGLPTEAEVRKVLDAVAPEVRPLLVVNTGHGLQGFWPLSRDVEPEHQQQLEHGLVALLYKLAADLGVEGLSVERTDLASVLRVPGTQNIKGEP